MIDYHKNELEIFDDVKVGQNAMAKISWSTIEEILSEETFETLKMERDRKRGPHYQINYPASLTLSRI